MPFTMEMHNDGLDRISKKFGRDSAMNRPTDSPLMNNLNAVITDMLKPVVRKLNDVLAKYVDVSGYSLISLIPELTFYLRWAELTEQMMAAGIPMCKPEVLAAERREFYAD